MAAYISFQPSDYFNTKLWTGTGATHAITGVGFQPDFIWIKGRNVAYDHVLQDVARGPTYQLNSNNNAAQTNRTDEVTSFDADGFTLGSDGTEGVVNNSGDTYVGWNWKAGGAASSNTVGDITSSVSVDTARGISIRTYTGLGGTGQTVGHGLGAVPQIVMCKRLDGSTADWVSYNSNIVPSDGGPPEDTWIILNTTGAAQSNDSDRWGGTAPTSTVFTASSGYSQSNNNGTSYVFYAFARKRGHSALGSYIGNGDANGPFVYTGFRPAFIIAKRTDTAGYDWTMMDSKRSPFNVANEWLYPNLNSVQDTNGAVDFCSTGFKVRQTHSYWNTAGANYIYMAFAEFPIVSSNSKPGVAR